MLQDLVPRVLSHDFEKRHRRTAKIAILAGCVIKPTTGLAIQLNKFYNSTRKVLISQDTEAIFAYKSEHMKKPDKLTYGMRVPNSELLGNLV